jgi:hypothetical protein
MGGCSVNHWSSGQRQQQPLADANRQGFTRHSSETTPTLALGGLRSDWRRCPTRKPCPLSVLDKRRDGFHSGQPTALSGRPPWGHHRAHAHWDCRHSTATAICAFVQREATVVARSGSEGQSESSIRDQGHHCVHGPLGMSIAATRCMYRLCDWRCLVCARQQARLMQQTGLLSLISSCLRVVNGRRPTQTESSTKPFRSQGLRLD